VSDNKDKTITVPVDDGTIPVGSIIVVSHVGPLSVPKVTLNGEDGVILQDRALNVVNRWRSAALIKRQENVWLISAGTGGGQTGSVPSPPEITDVAAISGGVHLEWTLPEDDGGHSITANVLEGTTDGFKWEALWVFQALATSGDATGLTPGAEYTLRLRSENVIGFSDPSNSVTVVPRDIYNDATGGSVTTVENYNGTGQKWRIHTFSSGGTLSVAQSVAPFRVLVVAGGGGGAGICGNVAQGAGGGGGGAGGVYQWDNATLDVGSFPVNVGAGGGGSNGGGQPSQGGDGGYSSISSYSTSGGGGGGIGTGGRNGGSGGGGGCKFGDEGGPWGGGSGISGQGTNGNAGSSNNDSSNAPGGSMNYTTNIRGSNETYSPGVAGNGGGGGTWDRAGGNGSSGIVVVAYRIG